MACKIRMSTKQLNDFEIPLFSLKKKQNKTEHLGIMEKRFNFYACKPLGILVGLLFNALDKLYLLVVG